MPDEIDEFLASEDSEIDEFLGAPRAATSMKEAFISAIKDAKKRGAQVPEYIARFARGAQAGAKRLPSPSENTLERAGRALGRYGPAVAGGLAAVAVTGGAVAIPGALAVGLGAGAGELS